MTILLTTKTRLSNNVGNIHGYYGPSDYRGMLDFSRERFITQSPEGVVDKYSLNEAVTELRTTYAEYVDRYGNMKTSESGEPRIRLMSDTGLVGVSSESSTVNYIPSPVSPVNGQTFTIAAASTAVPIAFSYYGSGSADIAAPQLTLLATAIDPDGRVTKTYTRSSSSAFTATLNLTGAVNRVQAELGVGASTFVVGERGAETLRLNSPFADIMAGGAGTIIVRGVYNPRLTIGTTGSPIRVTKFGSEWGGVNLDSSNALASGTATAKSGTDGSALAGTTRTTVTTGAWRRDPVYGIGFSGFGESVRVLQFAKTNVATGIATTFSPPDRIELAALPGIITHVVMYDRLLDQREAQVAAGQWMSSVRR